MHCLSNSPHYRPKSFHLQWHITEKCNLECRHCYFDKALAEKELSLAQLNAILEDYLQTIKKWGLKKSDSRITVMGGEPFLRKDFWAFAERLSEVKDKTAYGFATNGTTIDQKAAKKLLEIKPNYMQVSLDGMQKSNDFLRGKNAFSKAVRGIGFLAKEGIPFMVSMTANKANFGDVPEMMKFCDSIGAKALGIRRFVPAGRGQKMEEKMLGPQETKKLYEFVFSESQKREKEQMEIFLGCEDGILSQNPHYQAVGCSAGYASLTVLPNGNVFPCRKLPILAGNALKKSLFEIYNASNELQKLRCESNAADLCRQCLFFAECGGGAKCVSFGYFGDAFAPDPQCWRLFERLPQKKLKITKSGFMKRRDFLVVYKSQEHYEVLGHLPASSEKEAIKKAGKEMTLEAKKYGVKNAMVFEISNCSKIDFKKSRHGG